MRKAWTWAVIWICGASVAGAHEHWILADAGTNGDGRVTLRICSGHAFPVSEILLAERLLAETVLTDPDGAQIRYKPVAGGAEWSAPVAFDRPGVWAASFALRRPREDEALFRGRCLVVVGGRDDRSRYSSGKGLELVPAAPLSTIKPGDELPVSICVDGAAVEGKVSVTPPGGPAFFLSTAAARPARVKIKAAGVHLLAASRGGRSCSLTFAVAAPPRPEGP
jgi:hypothetical protein